MLPFKIGSVASRSSSYRALQSLSGVASRRSKADSPSSPASESSPAGVVGAANQDPSSSSSSPNQGGTSSSLSSSSSSVPKPTKASQYKAYIAASPPRKKPSLSSRVLDAGRFKKPQSKPKPPVASPSPSPPTPTPTSTSSESMSLSEFKASVAKEFVKDPNARKPPAPLLTVEDALKRSPGTVLCTQVVVDSQVEREIMTIQRTDAEIAFLRRYSPHIKPTASHRTRTEKFVARDLISGATIPVSFVSFTQAAALVKGDLINLMNVKLDINRYVSPPLITLYGSGLRAKAPESWWTHVEPPVGQELVYESIKEILEGPVDRRVNLKGTVRKHLNPPSPRKPFPFYAEYVVTDESGAEIPLSLFPGKEGLPKWVVGQEFVLHGLRVRPPDEKKTPTGHLYTDVRLNGQWHNPRAEDGQIWVLAT